VINREKHISGKVDKRMLEQKKLFEVSKSVYEFALRYQGCHGEISGAFPHQTFTIQATVDELEDLFSLLRYVEATRQE
jgi:hypothetical protein